MKVGNSQKLYGLAMGALVGLAAILILGAIIETSRQPDIGPPRNNVSAL